MRLPDVGEGVAEAELVQWFVAVGDEVTPESAIAEVLTDKATVEVASPVAGVVTALHGEPGDVLAVGSDLVEIETAGDGAAPTARRPTRRGIRLLARQRSADVGGGRRLGRRRGRPRRLGASTGARRIRRVRARLPHLPCGHGRGRSGSIWRTCRDRDPADASCTPISIA